MAKFSEIRAGDRLIADGGFSCIDAGARLAVIADPHGNLYVRCAHGRHLLVGQRDDDDNLVGFTRVAEPACAK